MCSRSSVTRPPLLVMCTLAVLVLLSSAAAAAAAAAGSGSAVVSSLRVPLVVFEEDSPYLPLFGGGGGGDSDEVLDLDEREGLLERFLSREGVFFNEVRQPSPPGAAAPPPEAAAPPPGAAAAPPPSSPGGHHHHHHPPGKPPPLRTLYQVGDSEGELPECEPWAVCSKVDLYDEPWLERQCRCPGERRCPSLVTASDGHTIVDKTRHFKTCEPVKKLPKCRYFRDITWSLTVTSDNVTSQTVHCHCPRGSVAYLIRRQPYRGDTPGYRYSFACSPQSRLRCQRKEPCRLFTVRKRSPQLDEVNTSTLCQCPQGHRCPKRHLQAGVLQGKSYVEENIRTYSGYCVG